MPRRAVISSFKFAFHFQLAFLFSQVIIMRNKEFFPCPSDDFYRAIDLAEVFLPGVKPGRS